MPVANNKIIVVDDHPIIAEGFQNLLGPDWEVLGFASDHQQLVETVQQLAPKIVILETSLYQLGGLQVIKQLRNSGCPAKLMVFTFYGDPSDAARAIQFGASAYLSKSCTPDELRIAFKEVLAGRIYIANELAAASSAWLAAEPAEMDIEQSLTPRQREIMRLFAAGYSAKEVGVQLFISKRTAENHKAKIKRLLGLQSNAELVRLALQLGLTTSAEEVK